MMKSCRGKKKTTLEKQLDRAWEEALAKDRREMAKELAEQQRQLRQICGSVEAKRGKLSKRDLSQINFQGQHWWGNGHIFQPRTAKDGTFQRKIAVDEAKAALIYEAMRRRPEVRQAWVEGKFGIGADGWQNFVGFVVMNLPKSWVELEEVTRRTLLKTVLSPFFIPPRGYSTFPDKSAPEKCRQAAMCIFRVPPSDDAGLAVAFVKCARKLADAGFLIVAVDNKTKQSIHYALQAIEVEPRSYRSNELLEVRIPQLSQEEQAERDRFWEQWPAMKQKFDAEREASCIKLSKEDEERITELFVNSVLIGGHVNPREVVTHMVTNKRMRKGHVVESRTFSFVKICREFEDLDSGKISQSDFVGRLRL